MTKRKMSFNNKYENIKKLCKDELLIIEDIMVENIKVRKDLESNIINFLKSPSKRIRPLLSLLYLHSIGIEITKSHYEILAAIELMHNASLIHDDIIDQSDIRRGLKTISYKFGNKLGVICGDYILSTAMGLLISQNSIEIINLTTKTLKNMCMGEINQHFDRFKIGTIEKYIEKSKNKTGYLFQTVIQAPLILSKLSEDRIRIASEFGLNFGIAFQIRDDILNLLRDDKSKPYRSDLDDGIYTAPVIYAGSRENYLQGVEKAGCLLNNYIDKAKVNLQNLNKNDYSLALLKLLELLND